MRWRSIHRDDTGASAVEYGLIVFAIAAIIAITVYALGGAVNGLFHDSCDKIKSQVDNSASATCSP